MTSNGIVPHRTIIDTALEIACRAPSVHNTQPWRWLVADHSVHLLADRSRQLPVIDHDGRELTISCGAVLHHARVAFRGLGWHPQVRRLPDPANPDHLATIEFAPLPRIDQHVSTLMAAIANRRTDRRPFLPDPLPDHVVARLVGAAMAERATLTFVTDPAARRDVIVALAHADSTQRTNPMYQAEIAEWTHRRPDAGHGVPARNVPATTAFPRGMPGRNFGPGELEGPPPTDDGAVLAVFGSDGDGPMDWLRVGEALSAVMLSAATEGIATCPLSQVAEVAATRDLVCRVAPRATGRPQLVLRVGWPVTSTYPGPPTPRRDRDDVVADWPTD